MKYTSKFLIIFALVLKSVAFVAAGGGFPPEEAYASARAQPHDSSRPGYFEYYLDDPSGDELRARYFTEDGQSIAQKNLRYTTSSVQPVFEIHDFRNSTGYRVLPVDDRLRIQTLRLLNNNYKAVVDIREVPVIEPTVVDAGFHRFAMQRWDQIAAGETVRFNFVQIDKARLVPMLLERIDCADDGSLCMRVSLNNFLQRIFVPPVLLTYDKHSRRLLRYSGFGPLTTERGNALPVTLNYQYLQ
jgi:hypothetical protein